MWKRWSLSRCQLHSKIFLFIQYIVCSVLFVPTTFLFVSDWKYTRRLILWMELLHREARLVNWVVDSFYLCGLLRISYAYIFKRTALKPTYSNCNWSFVNIGLERASVCAYEGNERVYGTSVCGCCFDLVVEAAPTPPRIDTSQWAFFICCMGNAIRRTLYTTLHLRYYVYMCRLN